MNLSDLKSLLEEQGAALADFRQKQFDPLRAAVLDLEKRTQRANVLGGSSTPDAMEITQWATLSNGKKVPVLTREQKLVSLVEPEEHRSEFSLAQFVHDRMTGRKTVVSGTEYVPTFIGAQVIDDVRALLALVKAGAVTINIDGPTNLAKITGDPTVYEHAEGTADISESDPTAVAVPLNPGTLAALVPLSLEVVQDSPNLDTVLRMVIAAAFAQKLETLSLATLVADTAIPDSSAGQDPNAWGNCLTAVGESMAAKQPLPSAMVSNAADFIARASQQASTAGSWLGKPPVLSNMLELPTTNLAAGTAFYGGFERGFAIAVRAGLAVEVIRYGKPTAGSHYLIAVMRAEGVVLQPKALFKQLKTVA